MANFQSDTLVFFGATGDLAYKKIFPSLQAMVKRGHLNVPVIGVAKAGWTVDQLRARAKDSLEKHGGLDPGAFEKLTRLLRYVDGDYQDPSTFTALRKEIQDAQRPAHYLATPSVLFEMVVEHLAEPQLRPRWPSYCGEALRASSSGKPSVFWASTSSIRLSPHQQLSCPYASPVARHVTSM
jgi:glucose-6-phosphate 1-dehydrogenase